jgi:hypothetical protein
MSKMSHSEAGLLGAIKTKQVWLDRYAKNPKFCQNCQTKLPYEKRYNKYCNHSCAASVTNLGVIRQQKDGVYGKKDCLVCGTTTTNEKFCCRECFHKYHWIEKVKKIEETGKLIPVDYGIYNYNPGVSKRYLAEKRGRKCEICGEEHWCGQPIPLVLDHISGDSTDDRLDNLRLVCGNCNMLLPTFAGRNRGHGRTGRYTDGVKNF